MSPAVVEQLRRKRCRACAPGTAALDADRIQQTLAALPGWEFRDGQIVRMFQFKDYYQTMAFVNAVAWIAHQEDHHPNLEVGYNRCTVRYSTHAIGGVSENDLICAAKVQGLLDE